MYPNEQSNVTANPLVVGAVGETANNTTTRTDVTASNRERERFEDEGFVAVRTDLDPAPQDDADKDIEETRAQIEDTRDHLAATVDAIREKLSPAHLVEEAKDAAKGAAVHAAEGVVDTVKDKASGIVETVKEKAQDVLAAASGVIAHVTGHDKDDNDDHAAAIYTTAPGATPVTSAPDAQNLSKISNPTAALTEKITVLRTAATERAATLKTSALQAASGAKEQYAPQIDAAASAARRAGSTAKTTGDILVETIKLNPLPAAIAGFGLGWLLLSAKRAHDEGLTPRYTPDPIYNDRSYGEYTVSTATTQTALVPTTPVSTEPSPLDKVKSSLGDATSTVSGFASDARDKAASAAQEAREKASEARDKAAQAAQEARDKAAQAAQEAREKASELASTAREKATDLVETTRDKAQAGGDAVETFIKENPIAAGAIALVIGAAVGLALPSTSKENEILGPKRDELAHLAADQARELQERVQSVAQTALSSAKESLGPVAETLRENVMNVADQVKTDVKSAAEQVKTDVQTAAENVKNEVKSEAENQGFGGGTATA